MDSSMVEKELRMETKEGRIASHLQAIDPVLTPLASKLSQPTFKDLSSPETFHSGTETLESKDLVAVHLTDTFPEDGVIHPTNYYDPKLLRFTSHFSINAVAPEISLGDWNWKQRKYAILIPFDKLQGRVLAFNPADTFVLGDIDLPDGTIILKDKTDTDSPQSAGLAKVNEVDFSQNGERISGFHRAVYEQMVKMGYFPQAVGERGDYYGWNTVSAYGEEITGRDILEKFCEREGLEFAKGNPHESHWAGKLEDISFGLEFAREDNSDTGFRQTVDTANEWFLREDSKYGNQVPRKIKEALIELIKDYQQTFDADVELPDLPPDETEKKAGVKIVDLSKDKAHFLHSTSIQMLPSILDDGIISIMFAGTGLKYGSLPSHYDPIAQYRMEDARRYSEENVSGLDLISVHDPGRNPYEGIETILGALTDKRHTMVGEVSLLISPRLANRRVRGRPIYPNEAFLKRRVAPRDFDGIVVRSYYLEKPLAGLERTILLSPEVGYGGTAEDFQQIRDRFAIKHSQEDPRLSDLYKRFLNNKVELEEAWTNLMMLFGDKQNNPYELNYRCQDFPIPSIFFNFSGRVLFDPQLNRYRIGIRQEWPGKLQETEQYIKDFKEKVAALAQEKDQITFGEVVKMLGMGSGIPPEIQPSTQPKKGWLARVFQGTTNQVQEPQKPHPLETAAPVDKIVALMEKILDARKIRAELNPIVWRRYIETVAGKKIDSATLGDFLLGLCKLKGLPLYNDKGEVLWPK